MMRSRRGASPVRHVHFKAEQMIDAQGRLVRTQRVRVAEAERELRRLRAVRVETDVAIRRAEEELKIRVEFLGASEDQLRLMMNQPNHAMVGSS